MLNVGHPPLQVDGLRLWEVIPVRRGEKNVTVVVCVLIAVSHRGTLSVHCPKETQYEHHSAQDHAAQTECLESILTGRQERCGAAGDDEHHSYEYGPMVKGRHCGARLKI